MKEEKDKKNNKVKQTKTNNKTDNQKSKTTKKSNLNEKTKNTKVNSPKTTKNNSKTNSTKEAKNSSSNTSKKVNEKKKNTTTSSNKKITKEKKEDKVVIEKESNKKVDNKEEKIKDEVIVSDSKKNDEEKNNKTVLMILLAILLIIIGVCVYYQLEDKEDNEVSESTSNEILDKFYEYFNSKEAKIIYYASSSCGYCELQTPIIEQIDEDYDIDYLYIDSSKLTSTDRDKILNELNIDHATPTTVVVKNGKIIDTNVGYVEGSVMVDFLKNADILDDDAVYTPEQYLNFINYSEYEKITSEKEMSVITIGQTGCSHCTATKPVLNVIAKDYDVTINYLNLTDMTEEEQNKFFDSLTTLGYDEEDFVSSGEFGTPLTIIVEDGKIVSYINGENPTSYYIRAFKKAGLISE